MEKKNEQHFQVLKCKKKLVFIFCLDAKEAKNQDNPYEIALHHSLLIFHA
jgi:hypothetical protein